MTVYFLLDSDDFAGEDRRRFSSFVPGESSSSLRHQDSSSSLPEILIKTEIRDLSLNELCDHSGNGTPLCLKLSKDPGAQQEPIGNYLTVETNS